MSAAAKVHVPTGPGPATPETPKKSRGHRKLYTKAAKRGRASRRKGAEFECEVAALARKLGFPNAARAAPMQAAGYAKRFADVIEVGRLRIECKRRASGSLAEGRAHVEATEEPGFVAVAVCRDDRGDTLAVLRFADLLKLERAALRASPLDAPCNGWDAHEQSERAQAETGGKDPEQPA